MQAKKLSRLIFQIVLMRLIPGLSFLCFSGCGLTRDIKQDDPFRLLYTSEVTDDFQSSVSSSSFSSITLSAFKMPISTFFRIVSDKFGIGIVYSDKLSDRTITAEFKNTDLLSVLNVLSRQIDSEIIQVGNTYYVGSLRSQDRGIMVRRVLGYDSSTLQSMTSNVLSEQGKCTAISDSVVVITDHESVLRRVSELFNSLDALTLDTWVVQLCFINLKKDMLHDAGFNVSSSGKVAYNIAENKLEVEDLKLDGLFNLSASSDYADVFASPMLVLRDGATGVWKDGKRTPIPKKTVSQYGVVTVSGYDYVDTGFNVEAKVIKSKRGGRLILQISLSDISGLVGDAPVTVQSVCNVDADLEAGRPALIAELSTFKALDRQQHILDFSRDRGKSCIQVWAQLYHISGDCLFDPDLRRYNESLEVEKLEEETK